MAGLTAQQLALLVALRLANGGEPGDVVVFFVATAVFLLPWAVLAVPLATSAFPVLSAQAEAGDLDGYLAQARTSLRGVLVVTIGAAAVLAVVAAPAARVLALGTRGLDRVAALSDATVAFAPGLVGYGLLALLARALYARGDGRTPAVATVTGWGVVAVADLGLVRLDLPRVVALGLGNTIGLTVAGALLLAGLVRAVGPALLAGMVRTAVVCGVLAVALGVIGRLFDVTGGRSAGVSAVGGAAVALVAGATYLAGVRALDPAGLRALLRG